MKSENEQRYKLRFNLTSAIVYIIGIILLAQLFNLQIVHGEEYRERSNTRLSRDQKIQAARGRVLDSSGNKLATTVASYDIELYKTKIEDKEFNQGLLNLAITLENNGDRYIDHLPILLNPTRYTFETEEGLHEWQESMGIQVGASADDCFNQFIQRYSIQHLDPYEARKIMTLRYELERKGFSSSQPVRIAIDISEKTVAQVNESSIYYPGISITANPIRSYPYSNTASHIIGYVSTITDEEYETSNKDIYDMDDDIGKTGIESVFEKYLKGTDGIKQIDMAVDGTVTDEFTTKEAVAGDDIVLTIDSELQKVTERTLAETINRLNTNAGAAVVMNCNTGEVLAMASYPDYNPNDFVNGISDQKWSFYISEEANKPFVNRAISSPNMPGSTFKPCTAIAALESGAIDTSSRVRCSGSYYYSRNDTRYCWYSSGHGSLNVTNAITQSCNCFFYEMGNRCGTETLARYSRALGLGKKTGIELTEEDSGSLELGEGGAALNAAIGQGSNAFTVLQMAKYTSMIANGGKNIDVSVVKSIISASGEERSRDEMKQYVNGIIGYNDDGSDNIQFNPDYVAAVRQGMKGVTSDGSGTASSIFRSLNIEVGGKTGSAQTGIAGKTNAWFIGFAPYEAPEISVVVMIDNGVAGSNAAVAVRDIIAQYFGMNSGTVGTEDMTAPPLIETRH